jgi:hypothetical protein
MRTILSLCLGSLLLAQCTPAKMALNEDNWLSKQAYKVSGRKGLFSKERMAFGEYRTTHVKRSWTKGYSGRTGWTKGNPTDYYYENILSVLYENKRQTVKFNMANDKEDSSEVYCISKFNSSDLQIGKNPNSILNIATEIFLKTDKSDSRYYVQIYTNKHSRPWELMLDNQAWQAKPKSYIGMVSLDADHYYTVVPVTQMVGKNGKAANMPFGSIGLEIRNTQNKPVAAVSLLDNGVVYLSDVPEAERFLLANICTALLLQQQIGG